MRPVASTNASIKNKWLFEKFTEWRTKKGQVKLFILKAMLIALFSMMFWHRYRERLRKKMREASFTYQLKLVALATISFKDVLPDSSSHINITIFNSSKLYYE